MAITLLLVHNTSQPTLLLLFGGSKFCFFSTQFLIYQYITITYRISSRSSDLQPTCLQSLPRDSVILRMDNLLLAMWPPEKSPRVPRLSRVLRQITAVQFADIFR